MEMREKNDDDPTEKTKTVPDESFLHVERSNLNGISQKMLFEMVHPDDDAKFWVLQVRLVSEHILHCGYVGGSRTFMIDIANNPIHALGHFTGTNKIMQPPKELMSISRDNLEITMQAAIENNVSVPKEAILNKGMRLITQIVPGMKVEVQSLSNPFIFWIATVIENSAGRLQLRYDAPELILNETYLFYTDPRIFPIGHVKSKGSPCSLEYPDRDEYLKYDDDKWKSCIRTAEEADKQNQYPRSLLPKPLKLVAHNVRIGMKLETINPNDMKEIFIATVTIIFDKFYFWVSIDDQTNNKIKGWLCHSGSPFIFPIGWGEAHQLVPKNKLDPTDEIPKVNNFTYDLKAFEFGFEVGMKLEAADPFNLSDLYKGTIKSIQENLLLIEFDGTDKCHWFNFESTDLFPCGWCCNNHVDIQRPDKFYENNQLLTVVREQLFEEYCPITIYFNYKCYSGPLISKNKLAKLPKYIGPGPLNLVIREVMNKIISIAYKPAKLLKDLEYEPDDDDQSEVVLQELKAKLKSSTHFSKVRVVGKYEEVPEFCRDICSKLHSCPNLFGLNEIVDKCPDLCVPSTKAKFMRRRRRRRRVHLMKARNKEKRAAIEAEKEVESGNESTPSASISRRNSESGNRAESPDSISSDPPGKKPIKRRITRSNVPPMEMKTRGAKLPNFAIQMKEGHWNKKDVQTIYNNTCVVPRKHYSEDSDSENDSSLDTKNNGDLDKISGVSDVEEPELKKLRVTPLFESSTSGRKCFEYSDSSHSTSSMIIDVSLPHDPSFWSIQDLYSYLTKYDNSKNIANRLRDEEIDGIAFMMLNLDTLTEHLKVNNDVALTLCQHITSLKWAYLSDKPYLSF